MSNFTLTILFFLSLLAEPSVEQKEEIQILEPIVMDSDLVITEIMYDPNSSESSWEWIEVYNKGTEPIDLSGYVLDDNNNSKQNDSNIAAGIIPPKTVAVLFDADIAIEEFIEVWRDVNAIPVEGWPGLNNSGDSIGIWDSFVAYDGDNVSQENVIEQVIYDDAGDWTDSNNGSSIYLIAIDADNTLGVNWALSEAGVADAVQSNALHTNDGQDIGSPGSVPASEDAEAPTLICAQTLEITTEEGTCSALVELLSPQVEDNVSLAENISIISTRDDALSLVDPYPLGETVVTFVAKDEAGNSSESCSQIVRVTDVELPTAVAQNITVELDENGLATILPEDLDNIETPSFDNCGIALYKANKTEFSCADLEMTVQIEFSVVDVNDNTSAITNVEVIVVDKLKPIMTCGADIITLSPNGDSILIEDVLEPLVTDNCDIAPILNVSRSDEQELSAPFDVGTTIITWQAVDSSGNTQECTQTITVDFTPSMDNSVTAFSISGQQGETEIDLSAKTINLYMPIGTDVTELTPSFEVSKNASSIPESGSSIDFTEPVKYIVTAQDGSEQEWTVIVNIEKDTTAPTFEVKGNTEDFVTELKIGDTYEVGEILNVVDESLTVSEIFGDSQVDTSIEGGPFLVTYTVSDGTNDTTITETVFVKAIIQPTLSILSFTLVNADTNEDLFLLEEGMEINSTDLPTTNLNIRANTTRDVMSVQLNLTGYKVNSRTESVAPFALFGDFPANNYFGSEFGIGMYTVSATPYLEKGLNGDMGQTLDINFNIVEPCANFNIATLDSENPSTCGGSDGFALIVHQGGTSPVTYTWSHDENLTTDFALDLAAGIYTVSAIDKNNCTAEMTFELKDPELPEVLLAPFESAYEDQLPFVLAGGLPEGGIYSGESVSGGTFDPIIGEGTYEITYTYIDEKTNCENSTVETIEVLPVELKVQSFTLVNADTNEDILDLTEGIQIDINSLPTLNLNIRANTTEDVESVRLILEGDLAATRTENVAPYALFGDFPVENYFGKLFTSGSYTITANPFSEKQLDGVLGIALTVTFELNDISLSNKSDDNMNVYPNPASIETTLIFKEPTELVKVYLYDVLGRMVGSYNASEMSVKGNYVLKTQSIPSGTYYIKAHDDKGNPYQKQVLIKK